MRMILKLAVDKAVQDNAINNQFHSSLNTIKKKHDLLPESQKDKTRDLQIQAKREA